MNKPGENTKKLLDEFPGATPQQWRGAAEKLLKGAPFDKVMTRMSPEGIRLEPIFWKEALEDLPGAKTLPGFDDYLRGTKASGYNSGLWEIAQELPYGTPHEFNRVALEDMMRGQNALNIVLDIATLKGVDPDSAKSGEVCGCGLSLACLADVKQAFKDIIPQAISFHIRGGYAGLAVGALFFAWLEEQGEDFSKIKGSLGMDPLAVQAVSGMLPVSLADLLDEQAVLAHYCAKRAPNIRSVGVSTLPYHEAGASAVEELGIALATGAFYLHELSERGLSIDEAAKQTRFSFNLSGNFFMEIAKLRAARMLWAKVVTAFGGDKESQKMTVHGRTGIYNKTRKDPYVNMLRTTTEALSGVIGGIDSLCVGNFDETIRMPDAFSRRISRNTQIILQEECELTEVVDPAGGSWAIEWLTGQLAEKSWKFFQEIESKGGIMETLKTGFIQERILQTAAGVEKQLNQRRVSLIGTNVYPNIDERKLENNLPDYDELRNERAKEISSARIALSEDADTKIMDALGSIIQADKDTLLTDMIEAVRAGATLGEITKTSRASLEPGEAIRPLHSIRLASKYEALRDAAEAFKESTGRRPLIFLCNLGPLRRHKLRADFTKAFFQAGGFEIISPPGFESPDEAVAALVESGAGITVVCGTDDDYVEKFSAYAGAIKTALPEARVVLAGFPGDHEADYRAAGMDDFIFIKSNNYEVNRAYLEGLGAL